MMPAELAPDRLYMFVVGPGFGESIVIRVPPDHWVVIDSCKPGERAAALEILTQYSGEYTCAVLTHRHQDHYPGFSQVLAHADWKVIGCADRALSLDSTGSQNPEVHRQNELEDIMSVILTRWSADAQKRWWTWRHTRQQVGDGTLTALHPTEEFARQSPDAGPNNLSSAMMLEWKGVRLLLGADVENPYWAEIHSDPGRLGAQADWLSNHLGLKVPHHGSHRSAGSQGALHGSFLEGSPTRFWVVTPYNKGKKLPGMEDGQGAHQMLQHVGVLHLTGLPERHDCQAQAPCVTTRTECRQGARPRPETIQFAGGISGTALPENDSFKCYVIAVFAPDGRCEQVIHGPGSIQMTE